MTGMPARGLAVVVGAVLAALALASCGPSGKQADAPGKQPDAPTTQLEIQTELDPCAEREGFTRQICDNAALAALDAQVREALVAQAEDVTAAGQNVIVENQRRWRAALRVTCGVGADAAPNAEETRCIEGQFRARANQVRNAVERRDGYTFQRVEIVDAAPVTQAMRANSGLGAEAPEAITRDIAYPRIDGDTQEARAFNRLVAYEPQNRLDDAVIEIVNYSIAFAGPDIVSVRFDSSEEQLGGASPGTSAKAVTVMMREGRLLATGDVFRANSGWEQFVTDRAVADLTRQFREYDFVPPEADVRTTATKPHLWLITERGLTIIFPPYSFGGPHVLGGADVTIPWADLRDYLNPRAPAPIRAQA